MIWALLAILGVPIWMVLGGLIGAIFNRRRVQRSEGVFAVRMRGVAEDEGKWGRKASARWVHDVLIVNTGIALAQTEASGVQQIAKPPATLTEAPPQRSWRRSYVTCS